MHMLAMSLAVRILLIFPLSVLFVFFLFSLFQVGRVGASSDFITQSVDWVEEEQKRVKLMQLLPQCKGLTLIFVERKKSADLLETYLNREGQRTTHITLESAST